MVNKLPTLAHGRCELFYKTDLLEDKWIRLISPTNDRKHNLKNISFDAGVTLHQASAYTNERCTVHVNPVEDSISIESWDDEKSEETDIKVEFECLSITAPEFDTKSAKRELGIANAKALPLALVVSSFKAVRLEKLLLGDFKGTFRVPANQALSPKHERVAEQIRVLLISPAMDHGPSAPSTGSTPAPSLPRPTPTPIRARVSPLPGPDAAPTAVKTPTTSPISVRMPTSPETAKDTASMAVTVEAKLAAHKQRVVERTDQILRETAEERAAVVAAVEAKGQARLASMHAAAQKEEETLMTELARLKRS